MEPYRWIPKTEYRNRPKQVADEQPVKPLADKKGMEQWEDLRGMLMRVLRRFPEAKEAVIEGIKEIIGAGYEPDLVAT